ncbi:MAG: hypothetical protein PHE27_04580 [Alphaproteobacteria bacterium]|nr:hypothetical protein [Alphaproteobacteria bacterium]
MKEFVLSDELREQLAPHHRLFQAAVAATANRKRNTGDPVARCAIKYCGGVRVEYRQIVIKQDHVQDDWIETHRYPPPPTADEIAVAESIEEIAAAFEENGPSVFKPYEEAALALDGPPLRHLFKLKASPAP